MRALIAGGLCIELGSKTTGRGMKCRKLGRVDEDQLVGTVNSRSQRNAATATSVELEICSTEGVIRFTVAQSHGDFVHDWTSRLQT